MLGKDVMQKVSYMASQTGEPIFQKSLLELCDDRRVLIENHKGIGAYSTEVVQVKVRFGAIQIGGRDLQICKMTADQLVISGTVDTITLLKGRCE